MNETITIDKSSFLKSCSAILYDFKFNKYEVESCIKSWQYAHDSEKYSHGFDRLQWLTSEIKLGTIIPNSTIEKVDNTLICKYNGNKSLGYSAADMIIKNLRKNVLKNGLAIATLSDCYPTGCLGQYTEYLAENGLISIVISSSPARVSPYNGNKKVFSTLGHSFGFPAKIPYIYDSSVSSITHGAILNYHKLKIPLPSETILNEAGQFVVDANDVFDSNNIFKGVIAIAGQKNAHRWSGLAGSLELLCKLALTPGNTSSRGYSFFLGIDPNMFMEKEDYFKMVQDLEEQIKFSTTQIGKIVNFAGENSYFKRNKNKNNKEITIGKEIYNFIEKYDCK